MNEPAEGEAQAAGAQPVAPVAPGAAPVEGVGGGQVVNLQPAGPVNGPAIPEHPYTDALGRLQGVKGDEALLLQTGARLITDEIARLRAQAEVDRADIGKLRERAHTAEMEQGKLKERLRGITAARRTRDGMFALGGVLAGAGVGVAQQPGGSWFGVVVAVVGFLMIVVAFLIDLQHESGS